MSQGLCRCVTAIRSATDHVDQFVARFVNGHLTTQNARNIHVHVFAHGADGAWVRGDLDNRDNRVADHVALPGWEGVDYGTTCCHQGHTFGCRRRAVHEVEAIARRWHFGRFQNVDILRRPADFFEVAQSFLFDGGQTTFDVAFGWLAVGQEPRPVVVSLSPHLVETQSSLIEHSSRCSSVAQ